MRQSNTYIILYAAAITIVCGGLLAFASTSLKEKQDANIALEQKQNILASVIALQEGDNIEDIYAKKVRGFVIDYDGNLKDGLQPQQVVIAAEYKKAPKDRLLPVYEFRNDSNQVEFAVMPVYGYGLWNNIWGFVAVQSDFNTVQGVKFQHASETPGLGARIVTDEIADRFKGKKIFDNGTLVSVAMQKGEGNDYSDNPHKVDGMSGATITSNAITRLTQFWLSDDGYGKFLKRFRERGMG